MVGHKVGLITGVEIPSDGLHRRDTKLLNNAGFKAGTPDGIWGQESQRAMRAFQEANGLDPTGAVDEATLRALGL